MIVAQMSAVPSPKCLSRACVRKCECVCAHVKVKQTESTGELRGKLNEKHDEGFLHVRVQAWLIRL